MIASVREKAGLGHRPKEYHPPKEYHNNSPECINNVIKLKVKSEKSMLDEFCSKMKSLAEDQHAPVEGTARMVKSKSNPSRPHLVQVFQDGKVTCDENCPMWTAQKICSHCVAVAYSLNVSNNFIGWFIAYSIQPNLTKMTTSHIRLNVGKKPSQSCYSQRKAKHPVLTCTVNLSLSSKPGIDSANSIQSPSDVPNC